MQTLTESEIVKKVLGGEVELFRELINVHQARIYRIFSIGLNSHHDAENLTQDTFIKAFELLERFDLDRDFGAWLRGIAYNALKKQLRTIAIRSKHMNYYREYIESIIDTSDFEEEENVYATALQQCCAKLPGHSSELVKLRYEQGMSFSQIAEIKGKTIAALRQALQRIRTGLRVCVERESHTGVQI